MTDDREALLAAAGSTNAALTDLIQVLRDVGVDTAAAPDFFAVSETIEELSDALQTVLTLTLRSEQIGGETREGANQLLGAVQRFLEGWA